MKTICYYTFGPISRINNNVIINKNKRKKYIFNIHNIYSIKARLRKYHNFRTKRWKIFIKFHNGDVLTYNSKTLLHVIELNNDNYKNMKFVYNK